MAERQEGAFARFGAQDIAACAQAARTALNAPVAAVALPEHDFPLIFAAEDLDSEAIVDDVFCARVIAEGAALAAPDMLVDPNLADSTLAHLPIRLRSAMGAPLPGNAGHARGAISVFDPAPGRFGPSDRLRMAAAAMKFAAELTQRQAAHIDPKTGLLTARGALEAFARARGMLSRYSRPTSLALIEISREGDAPLPDAAFAALARGCRRDLRASDLLADLGDGRLALLMPETADVDARICLERLTGTITAAGPGLVARSGVTILDPADADAQAPLKRAEAELRAPAGPAGRAESTPLADPRGAMRHGLDEGIHSFCDDEAPSPDRFPPP